MILLANKPQWWTSNDLVQYLKHHTKSKKCGHAGTLDPMATGLMILGTDEDTKKLWELTWKDKSYLATIDLSAMSDTRDKEYREYFEQLEHNDKELIIGWLRKNKPSLEDIQNKLSEIISSEAQLPLPPFSAKKIHGQKRYDMARSGNQEIVWQAMNIKKIQIVSYDFPLLQISCEVWSGTYIRSIAYWLGWELWTWWILTKLERTSIGHYNLNQVAPMQEWCKIAYWGIE